jgi:hypothetical protein
VGFYIKSLYRTENNGPLWPFHLRTIQNGHLKIQFKTHEMKTQVISSVETEAGMLHGKKAIRTFGC